MLTIKSLSGESLVSLFNASPHDIKCFLQTVLLDDLLNHRFMKENRTRPVTLTAINSIQIRGFSKRRREKEHSKHDFSVKEHIVISRIFSDV